MTQRGRFADEVLHLWRRHARTFWIVHSIWALATGAVVVVLAHERYAIVPFVVGFLALTWASTLFFSRPLQSQPESDAKRSQTQRLGRGFVSYATRVLYQETLFFLLPFYAYSAVWPSWNLAFMLFLIALAILACLDLVFDRWLQRSPIFGLVFFASVAFAALNLLLPLLAGLPPRLAMPAAGGLAIASAVPLAMRASGDHRKARVRLVAAIGVMLATGALARPLVPPVPLRLERAVFADSVDPETLTPSSPLGPETVPHGSADRLAIVAHVFAPSSLDVRVALEWTRDGEAIRTSREVAITAHEGGFRVWDAYATEKGPLPAGRYRVVLRTAHGQQFGAAAIQVRAAPVGARGSRDASHARPD